jgi:putative Holliday junction resolvase
MGRWLGVDYGTRRIGLACSDAREIIVSPADTLSGTGTRPGDVAAVLRWATSHEIEGIVVGLPLNMDGTDSRQTQMTRTFIEELRSCTPLPVEAWDERLSSYQADTILAAADVRRSRRQGLRDALAAQVILQSFLDARHSGDIRPDAEPPPGECS